MPRIIFKKRIDKESLSTKSTLTFVGLIAAAVCGGYILFLAIAAPQQLAEATTAATDVVCNGCVGTTDIADSTIRSADIANGRVMTEDIATDAITSGKILNGQVGSVDIGQGQVARGDIQNDAIRPNIISSSSSVTKIPGATFQEVRATCPAGTIVTGGGADVSTFDLQVGDNFPIGNQWVTSVANRGSNDEATLQVHVICIGPMP